MRVLAVASGPPGALVMAGVIGLSDPPRDDSAALITQLGELGVRTVMVTGDARKTAETVAALVGITGKTWATTPLPEDIDAQSYSIYAGVLPEDKYRLGSRCCRSTVILSGCAATERTTHRRSGRRKWVSQC